MTSSLRPSFVIPHFYRKIAWSFLAAVSILVLVVLYLTIASARIVVTVKTEVLPVEFFIKARTNYRSPAVNEESSLPARFVERVGERKESFSTTQQKEEAAVAGGLVTLKNTTGTAQPLVVKTRVLSKDGVLFRMQKSVVVPARGEVSVPVLADQQGKTGEAPAGRFTIPGLSKDLQEKIYGETTVAMTGGTKKSFSLTAEDVNRAKEELGRLLEEELRATLNNDRTKGELLATQHTILAATVDEPMGSSRETFTLRLQARVSGVFIDEGKLLDLARKELGDRVPRGESFGDIHADDLVVELMGIEKKEETAQLKVTLTGRRSPTGSSPFFDPRQFAGKRKNDVIAAIKAMPNVFDVRVSLSPFWLRRIPRVLDHITVEVQKQ